MNKKYLKNIMLVFAMIFGMSASAMAFSNSGELIDVFSGNDPSNPSADLTVFEQTIEDWFFNTKGLSVDLDLDFYAKVDEPSTSTTEGSGNLTLAYESDKKSGTWASGINIEFYSVKAGNEYALYWVDGGASSGFWSTEDLLNNGGQQPVISHLSTWKIVTEEEPVNENPAVPEPATVFLLGAGLLSLGTLRQKIKK